MIIETAQARAGWVEVVDVMRVSEQASECVGEWVSE